ncbi:MAG TPA: C4-dicarboxylate ABC transporter permease [Deltaproteobacteria bacterium]|jgi:TRAP-type mannitol/chloroaromatic compound transport system permease small subunit|nr:C4-dicarboxylate ABC transporter permease [Deltaproteobacteria bacterium]
MSYIERTVYFIDSINDWVGRAISWLLVVMVLNVFLVVVLRYVFSFGAIWMQELYVWSHAIVFLMGAGYTLLHKGHVRIDLIYRSASNKYKSLIDLLGSVFFALPVIYVIFIKSLPMVERSWKVLEKSAEAGGLPGLFLFKTVLLVFPLLFGIQFISLALKSIYYLFYEK